MESSFFKEEEWASDPEVKDIKNLFFFIRPFLWTYIAGFSYLLVSSLFVVASARSVGYFVEYGLMKKSTDVLWLYGLVILFLESGSLFCTWLGRKAFAKGSSKTVYLMRQTMFSDIQRLPLSFFDKRPEGRIVTRLTHDVEGVEEFLSAGLGRVLTFCFTFVTAAAAMFLTDVKYGIIIFILTLPSLWMTIGAKKTIRRLNLKISNYNSACNARLSEYIKGIFILRLFGLERWAQKQYHQVIKNHLDAQLESNIFYLWSRPVANFLTTIPLLVFVYMAYEPLISGALSISIFVAFIRYCERMTFPIVAMSREIQVIQQAFTSIERVSSFLKSDKEDDELGMNGDIRPLYLRGDVLFDRVWMSYQKDRPVLQNVSFHLLPGEKCGIVGTTGSGKTTTVSLLARLYDFQQGQILIDGIDIRLYHRESLRKQLGVVSQDVVLFKGSVWENLLCGEDKTLEQVQEACEKTAFYQVMNKNGLTFDSLILENGNNLSVGERQLLSITRTFLRNPSLLILDEATGNIDPEMEGTIHHAVDHLMREKSCLIVAHRLETLKSCKKLLVFNQGILCEEGTHEDLMKLQGYYYHLQQSSHQLR
jgi:ATP-binding cassette subfamily B multidrug efflux pump